MATEQTAVLNVDTGQPVKSIRELRQAVNQYRDNLVNLDNTTEEYTRTVQKLSDAQSELNRINIVTRQGGGDLVDIFTNTTRVAGNLSAGFTAAQGALALFGSESELLQQTFVRLQAAIALTQGLKGLTGLKNSLIAFNSTIKAARISTTQFNLTLLANPIVAITAGIIALIGYFADWRKELSFITDAIGELWASIKELIPGLNDTSGILDTITQAITGVATAVVRLATGPLKSFISLLKGDFKGALNEITSSFNILGNFDDGYTQKALSNSEKRQKAVEEENRKIQADSAQTTKKVIEENEARYGSDWKYTEDAKKLYDEYFTSLLASYGEDTEEYRKALNQKLSYDREYNNKVNALQEERTRKAQQEAEKRLKILQDEQAEVDKILKAISDYNLPDIEVKINDLTAEYNNQLALLEKFGEDTTELTRKYNEQVAELRKQAQDEINNDLYKARQNDIKDLQYNNQQSLNELDLYIGKLQNRLSVLQFDLSSVFSSGDEEGIIDISSQIESVIKQINIFEDEQQERNREYQENYQSILEELLDSDILTAEQRITVQRQLNDVLHSMSLDVIGNQRTNINRSIAEEQRRAKTEGSILDLRKKQQESYANSLSKISSSISSVLGEDTAAGKAFAVVSATIDTYKAAVSALANDGIGPARYVAFAAALGTGIATVKKILSTDVPGQANQSSSSILSGANSIPIPDVQDYYNPEITPLTQQLTSTENQTINQRVYIVESDIEDSIDTSRARVLESSF